MDYFSAVKNLTDKLANLLHFIVGPRNKGREINGYYWEKKTDY